MPSARWRQRRRGRTRVRRSRRWMLVESLGGIAPRARRQLYSLAARAEGRNAVDRTRYGSARNSPKSFFVHHSQHITKAAVMYDAMAIRKQVRSLRQRLCMAAHAAPAGDVSA